VSESTALPCVCGRLPRLVDTGWTYYAAWDGGPLVHYELRCPRWFFKCLRVRKDVAKKSPWYRWSLDLIEEWNEAVKAEGVRGVSYGC
jgi:hypothetical protein